MKGSQGTIEEGLAGTSDLREIEILDISLGGRITREIKEAQNVKVFGGVKRGGTQN